MIGDFYDQLPHRWKNNLVMNSDYNSLSFFAYNGSNLLYQRMNQIGSLLKLTLVVLALLAVMGLLANYLFDPPTKAEQDLRDSVRQTEEVQQELAQ